MTSQLQYIFYLVFGDMYSGWIAWNLFLAFIPMALSFWLYRRSTNARSLLWWVVFAVFIAFLPNAPYVLTDIIHLIRASRAIDSKFLLTLMLLPLHLIAILLGFEAYVVSLINQGHYLKRQGRKHWVTWSELATHALCAIGIYMGRFRRFNSWDLVTAPGNVVLTTLNDLTSKFPMAVIIITFLILTALYWLMKQITLGLKMRIRYPELVDQVE
ncbi:MAG TPA: DUF1361 domain-containing protein [Coleofasciculaceae cyanobacterium]